MSQLAAFSIVIARAAPCTPTRREAAARRLVVTREIATTDSTRASRIGMRL
jgi:hypothetical protein